ncbi:MAG: hypothetical protein E7478_00765 [Ruminococcaceae bacterium]|nr:hypothetical protein [Oscillospiraceae bacterium]
MIIEKLTLSAFGPYAGAETVDFTPYMGKVFLITGDTGAGKTTIFDGITYALFGKTSGSVRDEKSLRSQHSDPKTKSYAELVFKVGERTYTAYRATECKKRSDHRLSDDVGGYWELNSEIEAKIYEITGFDYDSFCRVSMLAQGEFDKFLRLRSSEREKTLRKLFGTEQYERFTSLLKDRNDALNAELATLRRDFDRELDGEELDDLPEEQRCLAEGDKVLSILQQKKQSASELRNKAAEQVKRLDKNISALAAQIVEAQKHNTAIDEHATALKQLSDLSEKQDENDALKQRLLRLSAAAELKPQYDRTLDIRAKSAELSTALTAAENALEKAQASKSLALQEKEQADCLRPQTAKLAGDIAVLKELLPKYDEAEQAKQEAAALLPKKENTARRIEDNTEAKDRIKQQLSELSEKLTQTEKTAAQLDILNERYTSSEKRLTDAESLQDKQDVSTQTMQELNEATDAHTIAAESCDSAEQAYHKTAAEYHLNAAALLAQKLREHPELPCPVCGSTEHKQLAEACGSAPSQKELEAAEKQWKKQMKLLKSAEKELNSIKAQYMGCRAKAEDKYYTLFGEKLPEKNAPQNISDMISEINTQLAQIETELVSAKNAAVLIPQIKAEITKAQDEAARLEKLAQQLEADLSQLNADYAAKCAVAEEKAAALNGTRDETLQRIEALQTEHDNIEKRISDAAEALSAAEKLYTACISEESSLKAQLTDLEKQLAAANAELDTLLSDNEFADEDELAAHFTDRSERDRIQAQLDSYSHSLSEAKTRLAVCEEKLPADRTKKDIEALQQSTAALEDERRQHRASESAALSELERLTAKLARLETLLGESSDKARQASEMSRLYRAAAGQGVNKISFERYIQGQLFDRVLDRANERLYHMSDGRYRFDRRLVNENARSTAGLDINIIDNNIGSGHARDVSTLSGGERFLASFALAIGLSDFALEQGHSRRSDVLFVDEGFSALDDNTFELALEVINKISDSSRMVGIVSHVNEIRQRFPDRRIFIRKGRNGSHIE